MTTIGRNCPPAGPGEYREDHQRRDQMGIGGFTDLERASPTFVRHASVMASIFVVSDFFGREAGPPWRRYSAPRDGRAKPTSCRSSIRGSASPRSRARWNLPTSRPARSAVLAHQARGETLHRHVRRFHREPGQSLRQPPDRFFPCASDEPFEDVFSTCSCAGSALAGA